MAVLARRLALATIVVLLTSKAFAQVGFAPPITLVAGDVEWLRAGDINGDGRADVVRGSVGGFSVMLGQADGGFFEVGSVSEPLGLFAPALSDMNGDGKADLMYVRFYETHIVFLPGTSTGEFGTPSILDYGLPAGLVAVTSADIDGDSDGDVIALGREGEIIVFRNAGGGVFGPAIIGGTAIGTIPSPFTGPGVATGIATGDLNGDGKGDFVACSTTLMRGISNGDGTFVITEDATSPRAASCGEIFLVDMNGDGHLDAVMKEANNSVGDFVYRQGQPGGAFLPAVARPLSVNDLTTGDLDADGRREAIFSAQFPNGLGFIATDASGSLTPSRIVSPGSQSMTGAEGFTGVAAGDFNGDGRLDLAALSANNNGISFILLLKVFFQDPPPPAVHAGPDQHVLTNTFGYADVSVLGTVDGPTTGVTLEWLEGSAVPGNRKCRAAAPRARRPYDCISRHETAWGLHIGRARHRCGASVGRCRSRWCTGRKGGQRRSRRGWRPWPRPAAGHAHHVARWSAKPERVYVRRDFQTHARE